VKRIAELLESHLDHMGEFLAADERGRRLPQFLHLLSTQLQAERDFLLEEMESLAKNVEHIKAIVAEQQSYAGLSGLTEPVQLSELLEDALRLNQTWLEKYGIEVVRQYDPIPEIQAQKQKVLQVLVNLVQNARDALIESGRGDRRLVLGLALTDDDTVRIEVRDNGVGIPAENLGRIFTHGFSTKQPGRGFGLHSCMNAAQELGGNLSVASDGPGCGASFALELPLEPAGVLQ
jgi:C4-dicarboxylate-specific signal transduction histidine kinase